MLFSLLEIGACRMYGPSWSQMQSFLSLSATLNVGFSAVVYFQERTQSYYDNRIMRLFESIQKHVSQKDCSHLNEYNIISHRLFDLRVEMKYIFYIFSFAIPNSFLKLIFALMTILTTTGVLISSYVPDCRTGITSYVIDFSVIPIIYLLVLLLVRELYTGKKIGDIINELEKNIYELSSG